MQVFKAPYSCVGLFHDEQIWQSAPPSGDDPDVCCGGAAAACPWFLLAPHPQTLVVQDALSDARFAHTIWVELGWRCVEPRATHSEHACMHACAACRCLEAEAPQSAGR
jgi:hypothetical protein